MTIAMMSRHEIRNAVALYLQVAILKSVDEL